MMTADATNSTLPPSSSDILNANVERERQAIHFNARLRTTHWIVLVLSLVITLFAWQYTKAQVALRAEARFDFAANQVVDLINERLEKYELALWAGVSAIEAQDNDMSLSQWQIFSENLEIEKRYPGINGIGVVHQIYPDMLDDYLKQNRVSRPDFNIYPKHDKDVYQPITYIAPIGMNAEAVGLDLAHEMKRHTSFNMARDSGKPQITAPIVLVQDKGKTPGFLFFAPFYVDKDHETLEKRQADFLGAVYAPFVVDKLIHGALDQERRATAIRISDEDIVIYDEIDENDSDYDVAPMGVKRTVLDLYGREWVVDIRAGLEFRSNNISREADVILIFGILIDLVLLALFLLLTRANRRGLRFADMATEALSSESRALKTANAELDIARTEAEKTSEMKSVFMSTMSHEIRTPLNAVSGILELLERSGLHEKQNELVQTGKTASARLIKLLTDVLDSSRLEANAVELWERDVSITTLVEEWRTLADGIIEQVEKDITVTVDTKDVTRFEIKLDDIRLSQLMTNLLDNAVRFTKSGTITIRAETCLPVGETSERVIFTVTDTGAGIAEEDQAVIFERFTQVDGTMTRVRGGSGLGLAICSDVAKLMGGKISVTSTLGEGSAFAVKLPVNGVKKKV